MWRPRLPTRHGDSHLAAADLKLPLSGYSTIKVIRDYLYQIFSNENTIMQIVPRYTLCFLMYEDQVLMLLRSKPPNQGLWNGVGGHIEAGETPLNSCLREVTEETGINLETAFFNGILTWDGFEIPPGGLFIFSAFISQRKTIDCNEGILTWQHQKWACSASEVVNNLHIVLPHVFQQAPPQAYHFIYQNNVIADYQINPLPENIKINSPWFG